MSEEENYENKPILTIDFVGLIAFAVEMEDHCIERVHALLLDPKKLLPPMGLCQHTPLLVVKERFEKEKKTEKVWGLEAVDPRLEHESFQWDGENFGFWDIAGLSLRLDNVEPGDCRVRIDDDTRQRLLDYEKLGVDVCRIKRANLPGEEGGLAHGVSAVVTIEHGRLSARRLSDPWVLKSQKEEQGDANDAERAKAPEPLQFFTVLRWEIFGKAGDTLQGPQISAVRPPEHWMRFIPGSLITVSNLCPLAGTVPGSDADQKVEESTTAFADVLAYYEIGTPTVPSCERKVFYPPPDLDPADVRPGSDPCSPLIALLSEGGE